jgi:hypothetical protein
MYFKFYNEYHFDNFSFEILFENTSYFYFKKLLFVVKHFKRLYLNIFHQSFFESKFDK